MWDLVCKVVFLGRKMAGATGAMESGSGSGAAATGDGVFDVAHIGEVKTWLRGAFEAVGKEVPEFEYTPSTVAHLHSLATLSQHRTHAANVIATDLRQQAAEYRSQAARLREILECIGLSQENLSQSGVMAAQTLANVAHLLDVKDTETSRYVCFSLEHLLILQTTSFDSNAWSLEWEFFFLGLTFLLGSAIVAMTELSLKKIDVEEKRTKVQKESKLLLDNTRKAIARLTYLKRWVLQHALW
jgi:HAUS augmin-like complex subunit 1